MKRTTVAVATAIVSAASAFAQNTQMMDQMTSNPHTESPWTIGVGAALPLGVGGEVNYRISPKFSVSVGAYGASFSRSFEGENSYLAEGSGVVMNTADGTPFNPGQYTTAVFATRIDANGNRVIDSSTPELAAGNQMEAEKAASDPTLATKSYNVDFKLSGFPIAFNYHPFEGAFHVTAGVIISGTQGTASQSKDYNLAGETFEGLNAVSYKAEFSNAVMPYLGIGGMGRFAQSNWGYMWEVGVIFTGGIKTSVSANGDAANPLFAEALAAEQEDFEKSLPKLDVLPLVKLGLTYSF